jgi:hypothetical protein
VKLEVYSFNDIEKGSFILGEVPGTGSVVESDEEFGVIYPCFNIVTTLTSLTQVATKGKDLRARRE